LSFFHVVQLAFLIRQLILSLWRQLIL